MIIDQQAIAPHFGTWQVTDNQLPTMGVVVLGLGWHKSGVPVIQFVEWRLIEDPDEVTDLGEPLYDPDHLFDISDGSVEAKGCWFVAFGDCDECGNSHAIHAPPMWADCRFCVNLGINVCVEDEEED